MPLANGARLGPYEVIAPLGSGGMGEVYRARDTRLGREVAIKVLPADRLADPDSRARFEREARAVAALNHPHIVTLHDVASADGVDFIVMEYVAGKTLDRLIPAHGMTCAEVLHLAIPMADAVARAHAAGIVHRDLKPSNVVVSAEGTVKVLDFGLAKLLGPATERVGAEAETATAPSLPGKVVGTAGYMSPEQASGRKVDERTDVFSFGVLLYQMVTGRRAFAGDSEAEALAAVLKEEPRRPAELAAGVPKELERIILRCLRKEPERRFQNMADVKVELQEVKEESDSRAPAPAGSAAAKRRNRRRWMAWAAAGLLILAAAVAAMLWRMQRPELSPPTVVQLTSARRVGPASFSPDGTQIAFASAGDDGANWDIWLKIVGEVEARRLTTDPAVDDFPSWSPDGKQVAFLRHPDSPRLLGGNPRGPGVIYLVSPLGGPERRLSDFLVRGQLSWSPDARWLAAAEAQPLMGSNHPPCGIKLVPVGEGGPRELTSPKRPAFDTSPAFSPDGRALAYASCEGQEGGPACDVQVVPLDADYRVRGAARRLTRQQLDISGLAWARDGRSIVYAFGTLWRVRVDGAAPPERLELAGRRVVQPSTVISRDRLAFVRPHNDYDIFRLRLGATSTPFLESTFWDFNPQYSPDGQRIAFQSGPAGEFQQVWLADAEGSNPARLTRGPGRAQGSPRWSPDGRTIAFDSWGVDGRWDVWTIGVDGSGLRQITRHPADENMPSWSRDGRFIYFFSDRTGRNEVWRVPASGGPEEQLTREGGCAPFESFDGRTLYYMRSNGNDALLARPTAGGEERLVLRCVDGWGYAVGSKGVYHVDCRTPEDSGASRQPLRLLDTATGRDTTVGVLETGPLDNLGLSVSPDGRNVLYTHSTAASDLMMIENFR